MYPAFYKMSIFSVLKEKGRKRIKKVCYWQLLKIKEKIILWPEAKSPPLLVQTVGLIGIAYVCALIKVTRN